MKTTREIFCERLNLLMAKNKVSCSQLAKIVGVDRRTMKRWMIGKTLPNALYAIKIRNYFEVRLDYLLGLTDKK